jgi:predicted RNA binding protein YcfA (HicA-like mRNA interferase family)
MVAPPLVSGRECVAALGRLGYTVVRQKGSHARLQCVGRAPLTIPMHDELDRGTLRSILRSAGLTVEDFVALLEG